MWYVTRQHKLTSKVQTNLHSPRFLKAEVLQICFVAPSTTILRSTIQTTTKLLAMCWNVIFNELKLQHSIHYIELCMNKNYWNLNEMYLFTSCSIQLHFCLIILWIVGLETGFNDGSISHNYVWSCNMENSQLQHWKVIVIS